MSSRRRKAAVTKRVVEEEDTGDSDSRMETDSDIVPAPSTSKSPRKEATENGTGIPEDLPEGTVIVQPEAVDDDSPDFSEPEFRPKKGRKNEHHRSKITEQDLGQQHCSACNNQIPHLKHLKRHPALKVLICKKCFEYYSGDKFDQDSNGVDEQCRWCGDGGNLLCCDFCSNAFCKGCIRSNLGRSELSAVLDADENVPWKCYVCNPLPLASLIARCTTILKKADEVLHKRKYERENREKKEREEKKKRLQQVTPYPVRLTGARGSESGSSSPGFEEWELDYSDSELEKKVDSLFKWQTKFAMALTSFKKQIHSLKAFDRTKPHELKRLKDRKKSIASDLLTISKKVGKELNCIEIETVRIRKNTGGRSVSNGSKGLRSLLGGRVDQLQSKAKGQGSSSALKVRLPFQTSGRETNGTKASQEAIVIDDDEDDDDCLDNLTFEDLAKISQKKQNKVVSALEKMTGKDEEKEIDGDKGKKKETNKQTEVKKSEEKKKEEPKKPERPFVPARKRKVSVSVKEKTPMKVKKKLFGEGKDDEELSSGEESDDEGAGEKKGKSEKQKKTCDKSKKVEENEDESIVEPMDVDGDENDDDSPDEYLDPLSGEMKSKENDGTSAKEKGSGNEKDGKKTKKDSVADDGSDSEEDAEVSKQKKKENQKGKSTTGVDEKNSEADKVDGEKSEKRKSRSKKDDDVSTEEDARESKKTDEKRRGRSRSQKGEDASTEEELDEGDKAKAEKRKSRSRRDNDGSSEEDVSESKKTDEKRRGRSKSQKQVAGEEESTGEESGKVDEDKAEKRKSRSRRDNDGSSEEDASESKKTDEKRRGRSRSQKQVAGEEESTGEESGKVDEDKAEKRKSRSRRDNDGSSEEDASESKKTDEKRRGRSRSQKQVAGEEESTGEESGKVDEDKAEKRKSRSKKDDKGSAEVGGESEKRKGRSKSQKQGDGEGSTEEDVGEGKEAGKKTEKKNGDDSAEEGSAKDQNEEKKTSRPELQKNDEDMEEGSAAEEVSEKKDKTGDARKSRSKSQKNDKEASADDEGKKPVEKRPSRSRKGEKPEGEGEGVGVKETDKKRKEKSDTPSKRKPATIGGGTDSDSSEFDLYKSTDDEKKKRKRKTKRVAGNRKKEVGSDKMEGTEEDDENEKARKALLGMMSESSDSDSESKKKSTKKKKVSPKKKGQHSQYQSSTEEDTDEDDKKKTRASRGKFVRDKKSSPRKLKTGKPKYESASSNFDSDLEKEIDFLSKKPRKSRKKITISDEDDDDSMDTEQNVKKKEKKKEKKLVVRKKKDKKTDKDDDATSSSESEINDEDEESEMDAEPASPPMLNGGIDIALDEDENEAARKQLLAEAAEGDSDSEDTEEESEDESGNKKKTKKKGNSKEKKSKNAESEVDGDSDFETPKKSKRRSKLERAKFEDSDELDSDIQLRKKNAKNNDKKKSSRKGRKGSDSEVDWSSSDASPDDDDTTSDSDSDVVRKSAKKPMKGKRKRGKKSSSDDSDSNKKKKRRRIKKIKDSSFEDSEEEEAKKEKKKNAKKKKDEEESAEEMSGEEDDPETPGKGRKQIRKMLKEKKLGDETKAAALAERERRERVEARQAKYNNIMIVTEADDSSPTKCPITTKLVLEIDKKTEEPLVEVNKKLIRLLKPHQVEAVKFLWDCVIESVDEHAKSGGSGCILAHCMGLGKTLSMITFIHTLLNYGDILKLRTCLVICPLNTVLNWETEWDKWFEDEEDKFEVYELGHVKDNHQRAAMLQDWQESGGILIIGYEMFRNLCRGNHCRNKKLKKVFFETLSDPGPDIIVCDEGHLLKNDQSALSKTCNEVATKRRVVLTGTPLQNNLVEYHCMVNFVKRNLLGTKKEFSNRFINPITNGQCADSTQRDVRIMKKRSHVLHEMLDGCVQRKDYSCLSKFLPPKFEYVISVRLSAVQVELYQKYLDLNVTFDENGKRAGASLFKDYQNLMRIWTHPWVLKMHQDRLDEKAMMNDESDEFIDDESYQSEASTSEDAASSKSGSDVIALDSDEDGKKKKTATTSRRRRGGDVGDEVVNKWKSSTRGGGGNSRSATPLQSLDDIGKNESDEWWGEHVNLGDDQWKYELSGKLVVLFEIIRMAEEIGDKVLVFSQSILSLNIIEDYLDYFDRSSSEVCGPGGWSHGLDYFRLDGTTNAQNRKKYAEVFNDIEEHRARLFLISTKAGSLGINLVAGNRVVIFDASWNPSYDTQSMFRVYRFGQLKPCYIYRFLAQGTMEEKIYERQVTKQSLSQRVVDEHQVERHFSSSDMRELYAFTPDTYDPEKEQPTPILPKDRFLADILHSKKEWILKYHHHDSLLENIDTEKLSEEDRKTAWEEYEAEKKGQFTYYQNPGMGMGMGMDQQSFNLLAQGNNMLQAGQQSMEALQTYLQNPSYINNMMRLILQQNSNLSPTEVTQRLQAVINMQMQQHSNQIRAQQELHKQQIQARQQQELLRLQQIQQQRRLHEDRIRQREWLARLQNEASSAPKVVDLVDDDGS